MSSQNTVVVYGIDLAKSVFQVAGLSQTNQVLISKKFRRRQIIDYFANRPASVVAMEACPGSHWMARKLSDCGHDVRILPAQYVKPFLQRQKNDANDAIAIAEASQRPTVRQVPLKSIEQQDLQAMHRIRDRLVNQKTRLICQARAFLQEYGIVLRNGVGNFKKQLPNVLSDDENELSPVARELLLSLGDELSELEGRIKSISRRIEAWACRSDIAQRVMSIPGIGALSATALIAAIGDGKQFKKARDLPAWLGLVPSQHSTGGKTKLGGISKRGNAYIRRLLIHGARSCLLHVKRDQDTLGIWMNTMLLRMHSNKVVVALANKLARIAWVVLTHEGTMYRRTDPVYQ